MQDGSNRDQPCSDSFTIKASSFDVFVVGFKISCYIYEGTHLRKIFIP